MIPYPTFLESFCNSISQRRGNVTNRLNAHLKVQETRVTKRVKSPGEGKTTFPGDLWKTNNCQGCQSQTSLVESPWPHKEVAV